MLPLWPESERLILGEQSLSLRRRGKHISASLSFVGPEQIDFDLLSASLPEAMHKLRDRKIRIVLANNWVRYLTLSWIPHLYGHKDWLTVAQNQMRERYGAKADNWQVKVHFQGYGQSVIAAAIDRQLAEGLDRLAEQHRWQVDTIEPAFASLVNQYPRYWRGDSWLLMAEHHRLLLAESKSGIWQRFSLMLSSPQTITQHAQTLIQQARQFSQEQHSPRLYLYRSDSAPAQDFIEDMKVRILAADWLSTAEVRS